MTIYYYIEGMEIFLDKVYIYQQEHFGIKEIIPSFEIASWGWFQKTTVYDARH